MLYYLSTLAQDAGLFNMLHYISVRAVIAVVLSFVITLISAPLVIAYLTKSKITEDTTKSDSAQLNKLHSSKANTPTMGGVVILSGVLLTAVVCCNFAVIYINLTLFVIAGMAFIGFIDDYTKLKSSKQGLSAKTKFLLQMVIVGLPAWVLTQNANLHYEVVPNMQFSDILLPFVKEAVIPLSTFAFVVWVFLVMTGTTNAVNLTDGLDGLASGCAIMVCLVYAIICYLVGRVDFSAYLFVPYVPNAGEMTVLLSAFIGSLVGFLWYNTHPAQIFMGDTGSLTIGGVIGMSALISKQEIILVIAGGIFVLEAVSVILQVGNFKLTGKRIFKCAPFHHHLQFSGWTETKIVVRLWILSLMCAFIALCTLKVR